MIITEWFCKVFKLIRRTIINSPVCLNRAICSRSFKSLLSFTSDSRFSNAEDSLFIHWRLLCSWAVRGWCPHRFVCPSSSVHSCSLHTWCRMDCHLHFSICMKQVLFTIIRLRLSDLVTGACVVASLQLAQSVLFPPPPLAGKLGIDHAPQGAVRRKEEACSGANGILPSLNTIALLTRKYLV